MAPSMIPNSALSRRVVWLKWLATPRAAWTLMITSSIAATPAITVPAPCTRQRQRSVHRGRLPPQPSRGGDQRGALATPPEQVEAQPQRREQQRRQQDRPQPPPRPVAPGGIQQAPAPREQVQRH